MPRRRVRLTKEDREGDLALDSHEHAPRPRHPGPGEAGDPSGTGAVMALQHLAGNQAVAGLVTAPGAGVGVAVQRLPDAPPVVQRIAPRTLRAGSSGDAVAQLQAQLNGAGAAVPPLAVDGRFGRRTQAAVLVFQRGASLTPDGTVGPRTRAALAGGIVVGPGPGAGTGHLVQAIEHQVSQSGAARGGEGGGHAISEEGGPGGRPGGRGSHVDVSTPVGEVEGQYDPSTGTASGSATTATGSVAGSYDASTGSGSASWQGQHGSAAGSYDASTGNVNAEGEYQGANGSASGSVSYNTETGSASGAGTWGGSSAGGTYDATTGSAAGVYTSSSGSTTTGSWDAESGTASGSWQSGGGGSSATAVVDTSTGTGGGAVHTQYGNAQVSYDGDEVHATVEVPGVGSVGVDIPPDPADWL
jgi:peptidoglycan hydrolase-like protein with peptidoglycan-binding domain